METTSISIWDNPDMLDRLDKQRAIKRTTGRLTFDCMNLMCDGDRTRCAKGKLLSRAHDGTLALMMVLRGVTSGTCKDCSDFTTEDMEQ